MSKSRALSLFAVSAYSMFMMLGCNVQTDENDQAGAGVEELGALEQRFTQCGSTCPSGWHPASYSCDARSCGGTCSVGRTNQVTCEQNIGTFTQCGVTCPSGWYAANTSCDSYYCGGTCSGGRTNRATCVPIPTCDPRAGTHGQKWVVLSAESTYEYQGGWCSIGTHRPPTCFQGIYFYDQDLVGQYCVKAGANNSCYDSDARWYVSCNSLIDCIYNCNGQCEQAAC